MALVPVGDRPTSTTRCTGSGFAEGAVGAATGALGAVTIGAGAAATRGAAPRKSIGAGPRGSGGLDAHADSPAAAEANRQARRAIWFTSKRLRNLGRSLP